MNHDFLTQSLRWLAPWLRQSGVIISLVGLLIIWTLWSAWRLWRASARLRKDLRGATRAITSSDNPIAFTAQFPTISADLTSARFIGAAWQGFEGTLVIPRSTGEPIVATADPRDWLELADLFRKAGADLRYHAALPGLLVGAGLAMTFLGIAAALTLASAVVAPGGNPSEHINHLRDLLDAASVKFITSLAGLALSIGYALFRKWRVRIVEEALSTFVAVLQVRAPFRTPAYLQAEANILLADQNADLQRIGQEFFVNLGGILATQLDTGLGQHIGPLRDAIDRLVDRLSTQNQDAMDGMLRTFLDRLEGSAGQNMRGAAETLDTLGTNLQRVSDGINAAAARMGIAAEEVAAGMGRGAETAMGAITEQTSELVDRLRDFASAQRSAASEATDTLISSITQSSRVLEEAASQIAEALGSGAQATASRLAEAGQTAGTALSRGGAEAEASLLRVTEALASNGNALAERATALGAASVALADQVQALTDVARSAESPLSNAANALRTAAEAAQAAATPLRSSAEGLSNAAADFTSAQRQAGELASRMTDAAGRFEGLDESLGSTLQRLSEGLSGYQRGVSEYVSGMDNGFSENIRQLTAVAGQLAEAVEEVSPRPNGRH